MFFGVQILYIALNVWMLRNGFHFVDVSNNGGVENIPVISSKFKIRLFYVLFSNILLRFYYSISNTNHFLAKISGTWMLNSKDLNTGFCSASEARTTISYKLWRSDKWDSETPPLKKVVQCDWTAETQDFSENFLLSNKSLRKTYFFIFYIEIRLRNWRS